MNPDEVVVRVLHCQRSHMIFNLLRERIPQAGKAPVAHTDREVLPLNVTGADMLRIGRSNERVLFARHANGWTVPLFAFWVGAVNLYDLSVVNFLAEGLYNRSEERRGRERV